LKLIISSNKAIRCESDASLTERDLRTTAVRQGPLPQPALRAHAQISHSKEAIIQVKQQIYGGCILLFFVEEVKFSC
jgi:hypothetical protein